VTNGPAYKISARTAEKTSFFCFCLQAAAGNSYCLVAYLTVVVYKRVSMPHCSRCRLFGHPFLPFLRLRLCRLHWPWLPSSCLWFHCHISNSFRCSPYPSVCRRLFSTANPISPCPLCRARTAYRWSSSGRSGHRSTWKWRVTFTHSTWHSSGNLLPTFHYGCPGTIPGRYVEYVSSEYSEFSLPILFHSEACGSVVGSGSMLQAWRSRSRFPMTVMDLFYWSTRNLLAGQCGRPVRLTLPVSLSQNDVGASVSHIPLGLQG
jgi:hypothetical protein